MQNRPEVTAESDDKLRREIWIFYYDDHAHALVLWEYRQEKRATTRHKYKVEASYIRGYRTRPGSLPLPSVLPDSVQREAATQFKNSLRVLRDNK